MSAMICFRVVKEPYGWAVRTGEGMMTPFRSRGLAERHARDIVEALQRCGEAAELRIEERAPELRDGPMRGHHPF